MARPIHYPDIVVAELKAAYERGVTLKILNLEIGISEDSTFVHSMAKRLRWKRPAHADFALSAEARAALVAMRGRQMEPLPKSAGRRNEGAGSPVQP